MESYFWFVNNSDKAAHLSDTLIAVMIAKQSQEITKQSIINNMQFQHDSIYLDWLLAFIDKIFIHDYTVTKYEYIQMERPDIMNAIHVIEKYWLRHLKHKHELEFSMDFSHVHIS